MVFLMSQLSVRVLSRDKDDLFTMAEPEFQGSLALLFPSLLILVSLFYSLASVDIGSPVFSHIFKRLPHRNF